MTRGLAQFATFYLSIKDELQNSRKNILASSSLTMKIDLFFKQILSGKSSM